MQGKSSRSKEYLLDRGLHQSLATMFKKLMRELNMKLWCQMVKLPGGENMSQSSPRWWFPDTFPRKNATFPRYGFPPPGKTVTPIAFSWKIRKYGKYTGCYRNESSVYQQLTDYDFSSVLVSSRNCTQQSVWNWLKCSSPLICARCEQCLLCSYR